MTDTVVEKANGDKDRKSDEQKALEAKMKKEKEDRESEEKNAIEDARNELLAPEPVDMTAIQTQTKQTSKANQKLSNAISNTFIEGQDIESDRLNEVLE